MKKRISGWIIDNIEVFAVFGVMMIVAMVTILSCAPCTEWIDGTQHITAYGHTALTALCIGLACFFAPMAAVVMDD